MKFYIASSLRNYKQVRELSRLLRNAGWECTYDWTMNCPLEKIDGETLKSIGEKECEGVKQSEVVIILTPQGRGTHTELGMAFAGKMADRKHRGACGGAANVKVSM